jgi:protein-S-isoprenylcysteine O-methyltransferase Ste14
MQGVTTRRPLQMPPVAVTGIFAVLMWLVSSFTPNLDLPLSLRIAVALALATMGLSVIALAVKGFREERTSVNPMDLDRTSAIVTGGIYRVSRNPMYLGMLLCLLAFGWSLSNPVSLGAAVFFVPAITRLQIIPEERALRSRFGSDYVAYCQKVRRWI